jgi:manganese/zinc/iron transport system substrate-binding protein
MKRFALLGLSLLALGCQSEPEGSRLRVVATTGMIADAVTRVGGDRVAVTCLMGPGVDPHRYTPTPGDLAALARAKVVVYNGLHLEGKMADVLAQPRPGVTAVPVAAALDPATDLRHGDGADGSHDPHVWFDVKLWMKCVAAVRDALEAADPAHAAEYRANADAYLTELAALDAEVRSKAEAIPKDRRVLVTSHDAFGYFAVAYGFEVRGLQGVSTAAETTTKDVTELAQFLGTRKIPAVFGETSVPPKGLQAVLDAVKAKYHFDVKLVGGDDALYSDALGEPGTPGDTYTGMVRHNIAVIASALGR